MKKAIKSVLFGKSAAASLVVVLGVFFVVGFACNVSTNNESSADNKKTTTDSTNSNDKSSTSDTARGDVPADSELQRLAKKTLMDFNDAIQNDDFSDFRDTFSKPFKDQVSAEKLGGVFHEFVEAKLDFSSAKDLTATFSPAPSVEKSGGYKVLELKGAYPTKPRKTNFEFNYIDEDGQWKLSKIDVNTKDQ